MRVVHLIDRLDGYGSSEPLRSLAIAQAARGVEVQIAALEADRLAAARLRSQGVQIWTADRRWPIDPLALLRLALWLRQPRDWLHAWGETAVVFAARLTKRSAGPRLASLSEAALLSPRAARRLASACSQLDAASVLGQATVPWMLATSENKPSMVRLPRAIQPWTPPRNTRSELLQAWGVRPDVRLIVTAGPLVRRRRLDDTIWNFELVRTLHERVALVVVGDGPDRHRLVRFAAQVSDPRAVVFVGYREDWRDLLPHADAYWEVSPPTGPLPQAACEALVAGVPVVVGRVAPCADPVGAPGDLASKPLWTETVGRIGFAKHTDRLLVERAIPSETDPPVEAPKIDPNELLAATGRKLCSQGDVAQWDGFYASVGEWAAASNAS